MNTYGKGECKVWLRKEKVGEDLVYILGGGERLHVGTAVVTEPGKKARVVKPGNHHDYMVLKPMAEAASKKYGRTVAAVGGVHVDNASKDEIEPLVASWKELIKCI
ncbi:MAG: hypothetical protein ABSG92_07460 [Conexivisphaerales archaeon]|jgi:hypothetical protein